MGLSDDPPAFNRAYWDEHWQATDGAGALPPNPYLQRTIRTLRPGAALDAGCGEGAEALVLADAGWTVTAVDISSEVLSRASSRAVGGAWAGRVDFVEADLTTWDPDRTFDLVTTHYAHPSIPALDFYRRIADWVGPGGTLLIVGHRPAAPGVGDHPHAHRPSAAEVRVADIVALFDPAGWDVVHSGEPDRVVGGAHEPVLRDVVVELRRRAD